MGESLLKPDKLSCETAFLRLSNIEDRVPGIEAHYQQGK
jgi:hypothetical protein